MNNKITFPRLAAMLADSSGRSKRFSEDFLREFFALITESLEAGESVKIKGLGSFRLSKVEPRKSVDVTTGQPMEISGHTKVVFSPAKEMADAVNSPFEAFSAIEVGEDVDLSSIDIDEDINLDDMTDAPDSANNNEIDDISEEADTIDTSDMVDTSEEALTFGKGDSEIETASSEETSIIFSKEDEKAPISGTEDQTSAGDIKSPQADNENNPTADPSTVSDIEDLEEERDDREIEKNDSDTEGKPDPDAQSQEYTITDESADQIITDSSEENRKHWTRGFIVGAIAAVALIALTIGGLYFLNDNFNQAIHHHLIAKAEKTSVPEQNATVEEKDPMPESLHASDAGNTKDSVQILQEGDEADPDIAVPTAPSDVIVYDTIGISRFLTTMAKSHYGNYNLWPYIYEENKAKLGHPDRISPGTPVIIPKLSKYGVDPRKSSDIEKAKKMGAEIYARYGKKI